MIKLKIKTRSIATSYISEGLRRIAPYAVLAFSLTLLGCKIFDPQADKKPLEGNRIDIFGTDGIEKAEVDPKTAQQFYAKKQPYPIQISKATNQNSGNLSFNWENVKEARVFNSFSSKAINSATSPIITETKFITLEQNGVLALYDRANNTSWSNEFFINKDLEFWGRQYKSGAILLDQEVVFATSGSEYIAAFCAKTGQTLWSTKLSRPLRGGLTIVRGNLVATALDSTIYVLNQKTGQLVWRSVVPRKDGHTIQTIAAPKFTILNSKATNNLRYHNDTNLTAILQDHQGNITYFTINGDKYDVIGAITPESYSISPNVGNVLTQHSNARIRNSLMVATFDNGALIGIDSNTQKILWRYNYGIKKEIWAANDLVYAINFRSELMAINSINGKILWIQNLNQANDTKSKNKQQWTVPIVAGNNVVTISANGELLAFDMFRGDLKHRIQVKRPQMLQPTMLDGKMYILAVDGSIQELQ